jgi:hypothetical protein
LQPIHSAASVNRNAASLPFEAGRRFYVRYRRIFKNLLTSSIFSVRKNATMGALEKISRNNAVRK